MFSDSVTVFKFKAFHLKKPLSYDLHVMKKCKSFSRIQGMHKREQTKSL